MILQYLNFKSDDQTVDNLFVDLVSNRYSARGGSLTIYITLGKFHPIRNRACSIKLRTNLSPNRVISDQLELTSTVRMLVSILKNYDISPDFLWSAFLPLNLFQLSSTRCSFSFPSRQPPFIYTIARLQLLAKSFEGYPFSKIGKYLLIAKSCKMEPWLYLKQGYHELFRHQKDIEEGKLFVEPWSISSCIRMYISDITNISKN